MTRPGRCHRSACGARPYLYSEVFDLKPTSKLARSCLKNPAHLLQIWFLRMVSAVARLVAQITTLRYAKHTPKELARSLGCIVISPISRSTRPGDVLPDTHENCERKSFSDLSVDLKGLLQVDIQYHSIHRVCVSPVLEQHPGITPVLNHHLPAHGPDEFLLVAILKTGQIQDTFFDRIHRDSMKESMASVLEFE